MPGLRCGCRNERCGAAGAGGLSDLRRTGTGGNGRLIHFVVGRDARGRRDGLGLQGARYAPGSVCALKLLRGI